MNDRILLALLLLTPSLLTPSLSAQHTFELEWKNPNGSYPVCSTTLNTWCDTGMTLYETVSGNFKVITSKLSPHATSFVFPTYPATGAHTYSITENYKDLTGTVRSTSTGGTATAVIHVPSATGPPPLPASGLFGVRH